MRRIVLILMLCTCAIPAQTYMKRCRGWGLYKSDGANTAGAGNVWITGRAVGFLWDNPDTNEALTPFPFLEAETRIGILQWMSLHVDSRLISYPWEKKPQFGHVTALGKITPPNNKDLRFENIGMRIGYHYNFLGKFPSISGFRTDSGTGFCPEGFIVGGGTLLARLLYERDFIAKISILPLKANVNLGIKVPMDERYRNYSEYVLSGGLCFYGRNYEAFCEFYMEGLVNNSIKPKTFHFKWEGLEDQEKWEVGFTENPAYLIAGGRLRYENGISLLACVPILLSRNQGSALINDDRAALHRNCQGTDFKRECDKGITAPFEPWYTRWKVVTEISFPLRYRQTGAEMRRFFLISKNIRDDTKIDIDRRLKRLQSPDTSHADETTDQETDETNKKEPESRLRDIEERRKEILQQKDAKEEE